MPEIPGIGIAIGIAVIEHRDIEIEVSVEDDPAFATNFYSFTREWKKTESRLE